MEQENVIEIGQIWRDNDKRSKGREVKILRTHRITQIGEPIRDYVWVTSRRDSESAWGGRETRISVRRFRNNASGYSFTGVSEVTSNHED